MKNYATIFRVLFLQAVVTFQMVSSQTDPCADNVLMEYLAEGYRNPNYTTPSSGANVCDYGLDETAWYRFESSVTNRMPETCVTPSHCGTSWPVWLNGVHPTDPSQGPVNVTVCSADATGTNCCGRWSKTIKVKLCEGTGTDNFYVYQLKNVPFCDMAYCAVGGEVKVLQRFPEQTSDPEFRGPVQVTRTRGTCEYTDFYFECEVHYPVQTVDDGARFNVSLTFDGKPDLTQPATHITLTSTSLKAVFESITLTGNIGKEVGCQAVAFWSGSSIKGPVLQSAESYWVGVNYTVTGAVEDRDHIEMTMDSTLRIEFQPTVPLGIVACLGIDGVDLTFNYDHPSTGLLGSELCKVYFKKTKLSHTISLQAAHRPGCIEYSSAMLFKPFVKPLEEPSMWTGYSVENITVYVTCNSTTSYAASCTVAYDPYVYTMDGHGYYTYIQEGDYLMYRSHVNNRLFEVHVRFHECYAIYESCTCAVAVRENNDIIGLFNCNGSSPTPIRYLRDPHTRPGRADIITLWEGYYYQIIMPSGATVYIYNDVGNRDLRVYLCPLREDAYHTSGLCGNYNYDYMDDNNEFTSEGLWDDHHYYSICTEGCEKYRLADNMSYINGHIYPPPCIDASLTATVCRCEGNETFFNCSENASNKRVRLAETLSTDACIWPDKRKKRQAVSAEPMDDYIITPDDFPVPEWRTYDPPPTPPTWPSASGITEAQAIEKCRAVIEGITSFATCSEYVDIEQAKGACIMNILFTDSLEAGVIGVKQDLMQRCKFNIENSLDTSSEEPQKQPDAVRSLLDSIADDDCPGTTEVCNGHGTCSQGVCTCASGYAGSDCSVLSNAVPELRGFRRGCTCDARVMACASAYIFATNFYSSSSLTCKVASSTASFTSAAEIVTSTEVRCDLPPSPTALTADAAVYTWNISLSNDAVEYSNELQLTVFDSLCLTCSSCDGLCTSKTDAQSCFIGGKCYAPNEVSSSGVTCLPSSTSPTTRPPTKPTTRTAAPCNRRCRRQRKLRRNRRRRRQ